MLDAHLHYSLVCASSDELSQQLTEAGERVVHPDVSLAGVAGQQCDHGTGDASRRADRAAVYAGLPHEGSTKPPEVTGKEIGGKLHNFAYRLERARPQPGRWCVLSVEQIPVAERPVDCRNDTPKQPPCIPGIAGGRDGARQLHLAVLVVEAKER